MGIQKDAGVLLKQLYDIYINSESGYIQLDSEQLLKGSGWSNGRLERAVNYLQDKRLVVFKDTQVEAL